MKANIILSGIKCIQKKIQKNLKPITIDKLICQNCD